MTEKQHSALSGTELHDPKSHASTHITSDAIQSATNAVNGLATSSHITAIEANTAKVTNATHTGEVTGATALTIATDAVTYDKMQDISGTDKILGRSTAGAGTIEEIACTAAGRAILDDADASAQRTTLAAAASGSNSDITQLSGLTTDLSIAQGGTGQSTAQTAINALSQVSGATNEHVFTKDTGTGNASWKVPSCSGVIFEESGNVVRERSDGGYDNDFVIGSPQLADDGNAAHDARMFFDKSKCGAFRAGKVVGTQWDEANIGDESCAVGANTIASGWASFAEGGTTEASGAASHAEGVYTVASGGASHAGGLYSDAYLQGQRARAYGKFSTNGDAQASCITTRRETTDATQSELFLHITTQTRAVLPTGRSWHFTIKVIARENATGHSAGFTFEGVIERTGANTRIVGSPTKNILARDNAAWDASVDADDANEALIIKVTGEAGKTIHWVASINLVEVG